MYNQTHKEENKKKMNVTRMLSNFSRMAIVALAVMFLSSSALAQATKPTIQVDVTGQATLGGTIPVVPGMAPVPNNWFYHFEVSAGMSVNDTIPLQICTLNPSDPSVSLTVDFQNGVGGNLPGVTRYGLPATFTGAQCKTAEIQIQTGPLSAGAYSMNLNLNTSDKNPANLQVSMVGGNIHIRVTVRESASIACYVTDSSGNFLNDCAGSAVNQSATNAGRFAINANKKNIEVSTNPGQFYYNVLWTNTFATPQTVSVAFSRIGVNSKGAQAIHASVLAPPFSGYSVEGFNAVNDDIPSGADDKLESIVVPAGWTLFVTYHLEWSGLGAPVPSGCSTTCGDANQAFSVTARVTSLDGTMVDALCTGGAKGFKK